jgi:hypothetical protein
LNTARLEVLTSVSINSIVFWDQMLCDVVDGYGRLSVPNTEPVGSSETSETIYETKRREVPTGSNPLSGHLDTTNIASEIA